MARPVAVGHLNEELAGSKDSVKAITVRLRAFRDARDWRRFHTPRNLALSIAIECGELLEHFQWVDDKELSAHLATRKLDVAEEIADVAIYVIQLADALGLSLPDVIAEKIEQNERRYPAESSCASPAIHTEVRPQAIS